MADNRDLPLVMPMKIGSLKGTLSGDATAEISPFALVDASGAEGSWAFTPIRLPAVLGTNGGLKVDIVGDAGTASALDTDDGSVAAAQANIALVLSLPYFWNGAGWVRGGWTPHYKRSAASTNATNLKATAGVVGYINAVNRHATLTRWVKIYNVTGTPNPASDTVIFAAGIPPNSPLGGSNIPLPSNGIACSAGVAYAIVDGESVTDNTAVAAGDVHLNLGWI